MKAEDLKKWRNDHGYTQLALAQALNVHSMTVSKWERGVREIPSFLHLALGALECKRKEAKEDTGLRKRR